MLREIRLKARNFLKQNVQNLTDDDVTRVEGKTEKWVGILQEKYGYSKDKAQEEYNKFMDDHKYVR